MARLSPVASSGADAARAREPLTVCVHVTSQIQTMFAAVNLRDVPLPSLPALLERLAEAGWTWEANRDGWTASFRKDFPDRRRSQDAGTELQGLLDDYLAIGEQDEHGPG